MPEKKEYTLGEIRDLAKSMDIIDILIKLEVIDEDEVNENSRKMICPFHDEKTPSLMFYEDNFHCFGCGVGGDVFNFLQNSYDISFYQACEMFAEKYDLELKAGRSNKNPFIKHDKGAENLSRKNLEEEWNDYLQNASKLTGEKKEYLRSVFPLEVGYDEKLNYYVFRYTSKMNKTLGFTKRRAFEIDDSEKGKYPKWKHSSTKDSFISECANMYNLGQAVKYIRDKKSVILVEGPKDVIPWLLTNNKEVVAISGTHNKDKVFETLPDLTNVTMSLDGDESGRKGTVDMTIFLADKMSLENIKYVPYGDLDPYDYYQKNKSLPEREEILDVFKEDELKELYNVSSLFNRDYIINYLSKKKHVDYSVAESFFNMGKETNHKKKDEDEIEKLKKSKNPDAMQKLKIKYGIE